MASLEDSTEAPEIPAVVPTRTGTGQLLVVLIAAILISIGILGVAGYLLMKSGRLSALAQGASIAAKGESITPPSTHLINLEPVVINLADDDGKTYLRIGLTFRVVDPVVSKGSEPNDLKRGEEQTTALRDTSLGVLGRQTAVALLVEDGKERLKAQLKAALALHNPELKVSEIYFTEFLVQR